MNDQRRRIREIIAHNILSDRGLVELEHFARHNDHMFRERPMTDEEQAAMALVRNYMSFKLPQLKKNKDKARIERMCSVV